jgi:hypothetical protein
VLSFKTVAATRQQLRDLSAVDNEKNAGLVVGRFHMVMAAIALQI